MCEGHAHHRQPWPSYRVPRATTLTKPLRVAIVGKGGAGKTTVAGALARTLAARGLRVLAIDADPDANLAAALPLDDGAPPIPLAQQAMLFERQEAAAPAGLVLLNPEVSDLLPRGLARWGGGHPLLVLGWKKAGGEGCYCTEHALLRRLLNQASKAVADVTLIDSEAGLEHLSRGTIADVDVALVVVEPGRRSLETAAAVRRLAADLRIPHVLPVVSGCRDEAEAERVTAWLADWPPLALFPFDEAVRRGDLNGEPPLLQGAFLRSAESLADSLLKLHDQHHDAC